MTSKQNIQLHLDGISACDSQDYESALEHFRKITPSAPILFNVGSCYLMLHRSTEAIRTFQECLSRDKYMAIGHFQLAVAQMLCEDYPSAIKSFQESMTSLRGNAFLDYKQLNLPCKLYASEVNFNLGLACLFTGDYESARYYIQSAGTSTTDNTRHAVISGALDAIQRDNWSYFGRTVSYKMIRLPEKAFYRVSKDKIEGLKSSTDFLGKAKVVSAVNDEYSFVGFVGARKLQQEAKSSTPPPARKIVGSANVGPPPSVPPPRRPPPTPKSPNNDSRTATSAPRSPRYVPQTRQEAFNPVAELQSKLDNKLSLEGRTTAPYKPMKKVDYAENSSVLLRCEFDMELSSEASYEEALQKIEMKLKDAAADLSRKIKQKQFNLTIEEKSVSNSMEWRSAWSGAAMMKKSDMTLRLRENDVRTGSDTRSQSPQGYKPARPAPRVL